MALTTTLKAMFFAFLVVMSALGCDDDSDDISDAGPDTDTDSDTNTDTDGDSGTDGDAGTDGGSGPALPEEVPAIWVSAGTFHSCAAFEGGGVKCWGWDQFGQLGYGYDLEEYSGVNKGLPSTLPYVRVGQEVVEVYAGGYDTCALLPEGEFKCWGDSEWSALGVDLPMENGGTIGKFDVPADYDPVDMDPVIQLDPDGGQFCAVLADGTVRCFNRITMDWLTYVYGGDFEFPSPAVGVCGGVWHTCAVLDSGEVYCWGYNVTGALGSGNGTEEIVGNDEDPVDVGPVDVGGFATSVTCGQLHTCAVLDTGEVVCWGDGQYGQLGYGNTETIGDDEVPADVGPVDVGAQVTQVAAGRNFTCAVLSGGGVKCWGQGKPAIGYATGANIGDDEVPADVGLVDVGGAVAQIDVGMAHTCALMTDGKIRCWGSGEYGRLGYGNEEDIGDNETPADAGDVPLF